MFFILFLLLYEDKNPVFSQKCRIVLSSEVLQIFISFGKSGVPDFGKGGVPDFGKGGVPDFGKGSVPDFLLNIIFFISWLSRTV